MWGRASERIHRPEVLAEAERLRGPGRKRRKGNHGEDGAGERRQAVCPGGGHG